MSYWMITNRNVEARELGGKLGTGLTYWRAEYGANLDQLEDWKPRTLKEFKQELAAIAAQFPSVTSDGSHEDQRHVSLIIHGYNSDWQGAARWYADIADEMFAPENGIGIPVLFTWPSKGSPVEYLADRSEANASAAGLADVLSELYDWLSDMETAAANDPAEGCKAKTSIIAHSMGNYVLQKAAASVWTRKNRPLLVSLINQLIMVAADVDNDLFEAGERIDQGDGDALANLSYRITALYSGLDQVLGLSSGLKHFGKRRLGRSGLDKTVPAPDNVWDIDCTPLFRPDRIGGFNAHGAYFREQSVRDLMRWTLCGIDRQVIARRLG
jgi:esterase/lipase superfamily enzyme